MEENIILKTCKKCDQPKPLEQFRDNKKTKDKKFPYCRQCQDLVNKSLYEKNKKKRIKQIITWNEQNPEKLKTYKQNWRENKKNEVQNG